jgi:hypothetical protein
MAAGWQSKNCTASPTRRCACSTRSIGTRCGCGTRSSAGLAIAGRERRLQLDGIGIDTWGVDFALLGADGALADNPRHYRDARTNGVMEKVFSVVPRAEVFVQTGIQFMQLNSLYQFYALKLAGSTALAAARTLLFMPDLLNYWLTGVARAELTIASTSQFYDPRKKTWARDLLKRLGLPYRHPARDCGAGDAARSAARFGGRGGGTGRRSGVCDRMPRYGVGGGGGAGRGRRTGATSARGRGR